MTSENPRPVESLPPRGFRDFDQELVELLSLDMEHETGYDSIPTIERVYRGKCCFPDCGFRSRDAVKMWQHVHFGRKHGPSFGVTLVQLVEQRRGTIGMHY